MPDPVIATSEDELRAHVERVLTSQYETDVEIGRGGMGIVYRARDRRLKRTVAIKLLPPELAYRSEIRSRFLREAETAAQLSHPNIVPIYSVDEKEGLVYFVMAYIDGDTLGNRIMERGALDVVESRRILREVADALAYAHQRNVVHRDIKPDNILLDRQSGRPMVTDFGIARAVSEGDSRLTATGMAIGTPAYMAPEQAAGERDVDGRTDLYSLGVVGYQMLTGELPFTASSTPAMLVKHISERPTPILDRRPDVPTDLARAVMLLLEKDPANRFPSAGAFCTALDTGVVPDAPAAPPSRVSMDALPAWERERSSLEGMGRPSPQGVASVEDTARWYAPPVVAFRRKLAPYIVVNAVFVVLAIIGANDFLGVGGLWTVFLSWKYAKLWIDGYDWRDVFKQPRDRLFVDVVAETVDDVRALIDPRTRAEVRARWRMRSRRPALFDRDPRGPVFPPMPPLPALGGMYGTGSGEARGRDAPYSTALMQATVDRDEIVRVVGTLPKREREQIPDVIPTADTLLRKLQELVIDASDAERSGASAELESIEREITRLEGEANPLDRVASEERVRRLAALKRQRRAISETARRGSAAAERIESCRLALQNLRYDVVRLRTGAESHQHITLVAERAMALAQDVDDVLAARDEVNRASRRETGGSRRP